MIAGLFRHDPRQPTIERLYGAIVAQARAPVFYRDFAVADTVSGRFDLLLLHLVLFLHRLKTEPPAVRAIGQDVFDLFLADMDNSLRDLGVGDTKIGKKMRMVGEGFYGRLAAYDGALAAADNQILCEALMRNLFPLGASAADVDALADYVRRCVGDLARQPAGAFAEGRLAFPPPPSRAQPQPGDRP